MQSPPKAIPDSRAALQSKLLVWIVGGIITICILLPLPFLPKHARSLSAFLFTGVLSLTFGLLVWLLRAATPAAAIFGAMICQILSLWTESATEHPFRSALTPLMLLFLLTFVATRIGKRRKPELTTQSEARLGRSASQVLANLGFAPLAILLGWTASDYFHPHVFDSSAYLANALVLAALAEATADTLSSELGQAFGGTPYLLTTFRRAPAGTDGAISLAGTAAGIIGAALVTASGAYSMHLDSRQSVTALAGATAGLFFDSLLGATLERRGWLNNDLVNFSSTAFAATATLLLLAV